MVKQGEHVLSVRCRPSSTDAAGSIWSETRDAETPSGVFGTAGGEKVGVWFCSHQVLPSMCGVIGMDGWMGRRSGERRRGISMHGRYSMVAIGRRLDAATGIGSLPQYGAQSLRWRESFGPANKLQLIALCPGRNGLLTRWICTPGLRFEDDGDGQESQEPIPR